MNKHSKNKNNTNKDITKKQETENVHSSEYENESYYPESDNDDEMVKRFNNEYGLDTMDDALDLADEMRERYNKWKPTLKDGEELIPMREPEISIISQHEIKKSTETIND